MPSPIDPPSGCRFRTRCWKAKEKCADEEPPLLQIAGRQVACHYAEPLEALSEEAVAAALSVATASRPRADAPADRSTAGWLGATRAWSTLRRRRLDAVRRPLRRRLFEAMHRLTTAGSGSLSDAEQQRHRSPSGCVRGRSTSWSASTSARPGLAAAAAGRCRAATAVLLWGPPGSGKTTIAGIISTTTDRALRRGVRGLGWGQAGPRDHRPGAR